MDSLQEGRWETAVKALEKNDENAEAEGEKGGGKTTNFLFF